MAFETITVGSLCKPIARYTCNSDTLDSSLNVNAAYALDAALRDLIQESNADRFWAVPGTPITLVSGTATYHLVDDFFSIRDGSMRITTTPFTPIRLILRQAYDDSMGASRAATGYPLFCMLEGVDAADGLQNIRFDPTPHAAANGKVVSYFYTSPPVSLLAATNGTADTTVIDRRVPPSWHRFIWVGALTYLDDYLSADARATMNKKWENAKAEARRTAWPVQGWVDQKQPWRSNYGYNPYQHVTLPLVAP